MIGKYKGRIKLVGLFLILPLFVFGIGIISPFGEYAVYVNQKNTPKKMPEQDTVILSKSTGRRDKPLLSNRAVWEQLNEKLRDNQVKLIGYTPCLLRHEGYWEVYVGELVLSGEYIPLLKVVHYLENQPGMGRILSTRYQIFRDIDRKQDELRLTLWLQTLESTQK